MTAERNRTPASSLPAASDPPNREAFSYWEQSWDSRVINSFSPHSAFLARTKWAYLSRDLKGRSGVAIEVGSGSGHMASLMAAAGFEMVLVDYSLAAVRCARNSWQGLPERRRKSYVAGDALSLPFQENSVDAIVSCGLLEHFENPLAPVREMVRVLRPGGLFYADKCPRKFSLIGAFDFLYPAPKGWYEARLSRTDIREIIIAAGLNRVRLFAAGVLPPRSIPGRGRFPFIEKLQRWLIERGDRLWRSMDGTRLAELLGIYYYVSAIKPPGAGGPPGSKMGSDRVAGAAGSQRRPTGGAVICAVKRRLFPAEQLGVYTYVAEVKPTQPCDPLAIEFPFGQVPGGGPSAAGDGKSSKLCAGRTAMERERTVPNELSVWAKAFGFLGENRALR